MHLAAWCRAVIAQAAALDMSPRTDCLTERAPAGPVRLLTDELAGSRQARAAAVAKFEDGGARHVREAHVGVPPAPAGPPQRVPVLRRSEAPVPRAA